MHPHVPINGRAKVNIADSSQSLSIQDGEASRLNLPLGESATIEVTASGFTPDDFLEISTPDGGRVTVLEGRADRTDAQGRFTGKLLFEPGRDHGNYVIEIRQSGNTVTLPFWHGSEPPSGAAPGEFPTDLTHMPAPADTAIP